VGGTLDGLLSIIGLQLCPGSAASMSAAQAFAYDTETGAIRPMSGGNVTMQSQEAHGPNVTVAAVDFPENASHPPVMAAESTNVTVSSAPTGSTSAMSAPMTLIFRPSEMEVMNSTAVAQNTTQSAAAESTNGEDQQNVTAKDTEATTSAQPAATKSSQTPQATQTSSVRRRFTRQY
jgi:hypothetical protein